MVLLLTANSLCVAQEIEWDPRVEMGLQYNVESNLFWSISDDFAPEVGFQTDRDWWEAYVEPGLNAKTNLLGGEVEFDISAVASLTASSDPYDFEDTGRILLETAALTYSSMISDWDVEVSLGAQEYSVGSGMLIENGASNGFERGALKLGPRKAWELAAIAGIERNGFKAEAYFLDPRELNSNNTNNQIAGIVAEYAREDVGRIGATLGRVVQSDAPYPQVPPGGTGAPIITPGAREGLNYLNVFGALEPGTIGSGGFASFDLTVERNDDIDLEAWAGRVEVGWDFKHVPWKPRVKYGFQTFSGDDPTTPELERFDPLYYPGSPGRWGTGSKASMVLINTNVNAHQFEVALYPTPRDFVTAYYSHTRANELGSPLQFGQATRVDFADGVPVVFSGVADEHLSDDFFVKYTRVVTPNVFLTAGVSVSLPGDGYDQLANGNAETWSGGIFNLVVAY